MPRDAPDEADLFEPRVVGGRATRNHSGEPLMNTRHAAVRMQQRGIPPLIEQWLEQYGEEDYDGKGGVRRYFSKRSIRALERDVGRGPVTRMSDYLRIYKIDSASDGHTITVAYKTKHFWRR
jgi:hypothetical protein